MEIIKATDHSTREALENAIIQTYGKTPDLKEVTISGKSEELLKLNLSHGDSVWGVVAEATDYKPKEKTLKVNRGKRYPSTLNGLKIK